MQIDAGEVQFKVDLHFPGIDSGDQPRPKLRR